MRISVEKNDPGYVVDAFKYEAYLDGVLLDNCITADTEKGEALCYKTKDLRDGRETLCGIVTVKKVI